MPSQGTEDVVSLCSEIVTYQLGCGPVLNIKNGGSRKEEYVLFFNEL